MPSPRGLELQAMFETSPPAFVRVLDFETTGMPEDNAEICEFGFVDMTLAETEFVQEAQSFVQISGDMPAEARAVHHISPDELLLGMDVKMAKSYLCRDMTNQIFCAHNDRFEQKFFKPEGALWIDTYRCALRAWPDFSTHTNQGLRYLLNVDERDDFEPEKAMPPHRALPDAYVTAFILRELLTTAGAPLWRLVELSEMPALETKIRFGKHAGTRWSDVPLDYLDWILNKSDFDDEDVIFTARYWMEKKS